MPKPTYFVNTIPLGRLGRVMIRKTSRWRGQQSRYHFSFDTGAVFHSLKARYTRKELRTIALGHHTCNPHYIEAYSYKPSPPEKQNDPKRTP